VTEELKTVHAAVGILQKKSGEVLLAERPVGKPWSGYWEFPGGKVEEGETAQLALIRELEEELGVACQVNCSWMTLTHDYPAHFDAQGVQTAQPKRVTLDFFVVTEWTGEPKSMEGQKLSWQSPDNLQVSPMLPANTPIIEALLADG